jgi:hypothetical protein
MKILLLSLSFFLTACQSLNDGAYSSALRIAKGTVITLNRELVVPPGQAGVYIPGGSIGDRYTYNATCRLETRSVDGSYRTLKPDAFTVYKVSTEREIFSGLVPGVWYAQLFNFGDGPHLLQYSTDIYLSSDRQPDVLRLVCTHLQDSASNPRYLTVEEISKTLGQVMTIRFP